jgi:pimeloyl-ACP methyl ester carboxylesterase
MAAPLPILLVPGLGCSARLYSPQIEALWRFGPVTVADHTRDETMDAIARRILDAAPPRFALAGLSMGGFISLAMLRLAPDRIDRLALLDTNARADVPERIAEREKFIALVQRGRFAEVNAALTPRYLHPNHRSDNFVKLVEQMADDVGVDGFIRQQRAIMSRPDSRPMLPGIKCPTLVLVGDSDAATPPELSKEMSDAIPGAKLAVVKECGHLSTVEQPQAVNAAMAEWLARP